MKRMVVSAVLAACCTSVWAASPVAESKPVASDASALAGWEIGTRVIYTELQNDKQGRGTQINGDWGGSYLGSLNYIDEEQDYVPSRLYVQYFFGEYLGAGLSYDKIEAQTGERDRGGDPNNDGPGDGIVGGEGPLLYLVCRVPNKSIFVPFAEAGVAYYFSYFDENDWSDGGRRFMKTDDTAALVLAIGCDVKLTENLSINAYLRTVENADIDIESWRRDADDPERTGSFPLDYYGVGLGVKYAF